METVHETINWRHVISPKWAPIVEAGTVGDAVRQAVGNAEATSAVQLRQNDDHLTVKECKKIKMCKKVSKSTKIVQLTGVGAVWSPPFAAWIEWRRH